MRSTWCLVLPLLFGCSGKHIVAGSDKTKSEQLAESLPTWCREVCETLSVCAAQTPCDCAGDSCTCVETDVAECQQDCQQELQRYAARGDTCATIGQRFQTCVDQVSCDEFSSSKANACEPTRAEQAACPDDEADEPSGAAPVASGGTTFSAGAGGAPSIGGTGVGGATGGAAPGAAGEGSGGAAGTAGATYGEPVSCLGAYGVGGGTGSDAGAVVCEEGRLDCSDGHDYGWLCARGANLSLACSCFVDAELTRGFDPFSEGCPSLERVNEACGFALSQ